MTDVKAPLGARVQNAYVDGVERVERACAPLVNAIVTKFADEAIAAAGMGKRGFAGLTEDNLRRNGLTRLVGNAKCFDAEWFLPCPVAGIKGVAADVTGHEKYETIVKGLFTEALKNEGIEVLGWTKTAGMLAAAIRPMTPITD